MVVVRAAIAARAVTVPVPVLSIGACAGGLVPSASAPSPKTTQVITQQGTADSAGARKVTEQVQRQQENPIAVVIQQCGGANLEKCCGITEGLIRDKGDGNLQSGDKVSARQ